MPIFTKAKPGFAVRRTVAAYNSSALEKASADYICDGVDDQAEINAAFAALGSSGIVQLFSGTFKLSDSVVVPASSKGFQIVGLGLLNTVLTWATTGNTITASRSALLYVDDDCDTTQIRDLKIDGNNAKTTSGGALNGLQFGLRENGFHVQRVQIQYASGSGVFGGGGYADPHSVFEDVRATNCAGSGFNAWESSTGTRYIRCDGSSNGGHGFTGAQDYSFTCQSCVASFNHQDGFNIPWGPPSQTAMDFIDCWANQNSGSGFNVAQDGSRLTNCWALLNAQNGFIVGGRKIVLSGCVAEGNGTQSALAFSGFLVTAPGSGYPPPAGTLLIGCMVRFGNNEQYGLNIKTNAIAGTPTNTQVVGMSYANAVPSGGVEFYSDETDAVSNQPAQLLTPPASPLVSGTVYQNMTGQTIDAAVPVTFNPDGSNPATVAVAIGTAAAPATLWTDSEPAAAVPGAVRTIRFRVPPGWYYSLTAALATIGSVAFIGE